MKVLFCLYRLHSQMLALDIFNGSCFRSGSLAVQTSGTMEDSIIF